MAESGVIVLWATGEPADGRVWAASAPPGLRVLPVSPASLSDAADAALPRAPVIAVVGQEGEVDPALAMGIDEVLALDTVSTGALVAASKRARARAIGRLSRSGASQAAQDWRAVELLAASLNARVVTPLAVATLSADIVRAAMRSVVAAGDTPLRDSSGRDAHGDGDGDGDDTRDGQIQFAFAPPSAELHATVDELAGALREALNAVAQVHALFSPDDHDEPSDVFAELREFARVVRPVVERFAEFKTDFPAERPLSRMPRSKLVHVVAALVGSALHAVRGRRPAGVITLRARVWSNAAVVDVRDNGAAMSPAARAYALDPLLTLRSGTDAGRWLRLAEQVRRAGGQLLLDPGPSSETAVRLVLPLVGSRDEVAFREDDGAPSPADPSRGGAFA